VNIDSRSGRRPHRLRDRLRKEATAAILAAAEEVFAEEGLHAASMSEIARRAGVAVGTLYNHFEDRQALIEALIFQRHAELVAELDACEAKSARGGFRAHLEGVVATFLRSVEAHRAFFLLLVQEGHAPAKKGSATVKILNQRFERVVRRGLKERALRKTGARLLPSFLLGLLRSVATRQLYFDDPAPLPAYADEIVAFFLDGARVR
jgi:AcrR family transcriptional regulator